MSARLKRTTDITLESWENGFCVACFPVAKDTLNFAIQKHRRFRLAFWFDSIEAATKCFEDLQTDLVALDTYKNNAEHPDYLDYVLKD